MSKFKLLEEINDEDFGFKSTFDNEQVKIRKAVRGIIFDENNKIAILSLRKWEYYMVPWWWIEQWENEEQAIKRELKEECGIEIKDIKILWYTQENRWEKVMSDIWTNWSWINLSYWFVGRIDGQKWEPNLEPDEIEEQTETLRVDIDEAIKLFETTAIDNKIWHFVRKRDLVFLYEVKKYYLN